MADPNTDPDRRSGLEGAGPTGAAALADCIGRGRRSDDADSTTAGDAVVAATPLEITAEAYQNDATANVEQSGRSHLTGKHGSGLLAGRESTARVASELGSPPGDTVRFDSDGAGDAPRTRPAATDVCVSEHLPTEGESA